jgi:hypothetical protein
VEKLSKRPFPSQKLDNQDDNFVVFTGQSDRPLFPNADANYLFATARSNVTPKGDDHASGRHLVRLVPDPLRVMLDHSEDYIVPMTMLASANTPALIKSCPLRPLTSHLMH